MSLFVLKLIALVTMTIDHVGRFFFADQIEPILVGRLAFPIFAWGIANGYHHTKHVRTYMTRLMIFAIISQIPFTLTYLALLYPPTVLNIFFTLFLGLCAIILYERVPQRWLAWLGVIALAILATAIPTDYGGYGVLLVLVFHMTYGKPWRMLGFQSLLWAVLFIFGQLVLLTPLRDVAIANYIPQTITLQIVALFSVGLISLYNGAQGIKMKWLFYWYYPLHLFVLLFIAFVLL
jgi:hypothetical protein